MQTGPRGVCSARTGPSPVLPVEAVQRRRRRCAAIPPADVHVQHVPIDELHVHGLREDFLRIPFPGPLHELE
eukprot:3964988-Alexandrium_andersonii.AAC.1